NVVEAGRERGGLVNVSLEQILQWNPDTIITTDRNFADQAKAGPAWSDVEAVQRGAAVSTPLARVSAFPACESTSTATCVTAGTSSRRNSNRFAATSTVRILTPVMLLPGRARLATRPSPTGSSPTIKTIGVGVVAALAARAAAAPPGDTMTAAR